MRAIVFTAGMLLLLLQAAASAAQPYPEIPVFTVDNRGRFPGLAAFIEHLKAAVEARDRAAIDAAISPHFRWERDFGATFDASKSASENFERAFALDAPDSDADEPSGWRRLAEKLAARSLGRWGGAEQGINACLPAEASLGTAETAPDKALEEKAYRIANGLRSDFWLQWGYVEGTDVLVRARPGTASPALDVLSRQAVWVTDWRGRSGPDGKGGHKWIPVNSPAGFSGYVRADLVTAFLEDRICFGRDDNGRWKIIAYVGGGD